jgi:hypothetical protein
MLKVLFLDIDGVVLSGEELWRTGNNRYLPPEKIALVNDVCERTGACVVVSSTWRRFDECADLLRFAGLRHIHKDWRTSLEGREGILFKGEVRGEQIKRWLAEHPETCAYAIVDDDSDMLPEQMGRFVKTAFPTGLEQSHADALVECLSMPLAA